MASSERTDATPNSTAPATPVAAPASREGLATPASGTDPRGQEHANSSSGPEAPSALTDPIRFSCLMNARYHASREAFLDTVHRWFMFAVIAFGAGALVDVVPKDWYGIVGISVTIKEAFAAMAAIVAALDLTFDLSNRARTHSMMKRRYFELMADLMQDRMSPAEARACLHRFSADEEPVFDIVLKDSWNAAQEMVYGDAADCYDIPRRDLFWKHFWRGGAQYPLKPKPAPSSP